jgi:RHS repeat-associated protein
MSLLGGISAAQLPLPVTSTYEDHGAYAINLQDLSVVINATFRKKSGLIPFMATGSTVANHFTNRVDHNQGFNRYLAPGVVQYPQVALDLVGTIATFTKSLGQCPDSSNTGIYNSWGMYTRGAGANTFVLASGSANQVDTKGCIASTMTLIAADGSGLTMVITSYPSESITIYGSDGRHITSTSTWSLITGNGSVGGFNNLYDSNGNSISATAVSPFVYTDSLGLPALTLTVSGNTTSTYSWTDVLSNTQATTATSTPYYPATVFGCASPSLDWVSTTQSYYMTKLAYPDGTNLQIGYEQTPSHTSAYTTGRIHTINLPTGGLVTFNYTGAFQCLYLVPTTMTRMTTDGTWSYTLWNTSTGNTTTVVDPAGNRTVYSFIQTVTWAGSLPMLSGKTVTDAASNVLSTVSYCYNAATDCTAPVNMPVTQLDTYTTPTGMSVSNHLKQAFDSLGNLLTSSIYDFGSSTASFTTTNTYGTYGTSGCTNIGNYIANKLCDSVTKDAAGNIVAEQRMTYDASGNLLTASVRKDSSTFLSSSATYNGTGTVATSSSETGVASSFTYGACSGAFPTVSTVGGITTHASWNCDGGVQTDATDANGAYTQFGYTTATGQADPFWRQLSTTYPLLDVSRTVYGANTLERIFDCRSNCGSWTVDSDSITTIDGYSRPIRTQTKRGSTYDTVSTIYNVLAGTVKTSVPCAVALGVDCTTGFTTAVLDAAARTSSITDGGGAIVSNVFAGSSTEARATSTLSPAPTGENNKVGVRSIDGLGRITSNCGVLTGSSTACGHGSPSNGILTAYSYATAAGSSTVTATRGAETKTTTTDALGRKLSETLPESGTTTYIYDSYAPGTCGGWTSEPGELMLVTRANGSQQCFVHSDGLHRLTDMGSVNGSTGYPCRRFRYDSTAQALQSTPTGYVGNNLIGRMLEAETDTCGVSGGHYVMITDEWFSYDSEGRLTDVWESTPHSGGYLHTSATYYANGTVNTLSGIPGYSTLTYGLDADGNANSLAVGTQAVISGVTYGPVGVLNIEVGSGTDEDEYTYYTATGKMNTYQFFVGAANTKGTLTWDSNGSLGTLAIADGFNTGGSHTCNFAYDDVSRLVTDSCGTPWSQTFTYDQYNNLTKGGNSTWNPGYNTKNQYSTIGATYDGSGNITYDGATHYTWDGYGKMLSFGSYGIIYDALGRAVENNSGGSSPYGLYLMSPIGKTALLQASPLSVVDSTIPLPGGGELSLSGTSVSYLHSDWLATKRVKSSVPATGNGTVLFDSASAPYGETYLTFGSSPLDTFTGDASWLSPQVSDTPNREYRMGQGRWLSPDPAGAGWNAYAYGTDPNTQTDPSGLFVVPHPGAGSTVNTTEIAMQMAWYDWELTYVLGTVPANKAVGIVSTIQCMGSCENGAPIVPGSIGVTDTNGTVWLDTSTGIIRSLTGSVRAPSDAAWSLLAGTFNAPVAGFNHAVCGGNVTCGLFLGFALAVIGEGSPSAEVELSEEGLALVENHLAQFGQWDHNDAMMERLWSLLDAGEPATGADANFYLHEAYEAQMMAQGMGQEAAHAAALEYYGASPYSIYAPEVIQANPSLFNNSWLAYWGLPLQ